MKSFKKVVTSLALVACVFYFSSCATILGGHISDYQRTKPAPGQPSRKIRIVPFLVDGPIGWLVDFSTGAIYKPQPQAK